MKRVVLAVALLGCERAGSPTYAIGWEPPRAGEMVEVVTHTSTRSASGTASTRDVHVVVEHSAVSGDRITAEHRRYVTIAIDGVAQPAGDYRVTSRGDQIDVQRLDGALTDEERHSQIFAARLALAEPGARKDLVEHRFRIGEPYRVPVEQVDALGLGSNLDLTLVLRGAHDDVLEFDITGASRDGDATLRGTLETHGPNLRYFHRVVDAERRTGGGFHSDQLQSKP